MENIKCGLRKDRERERKKCNLFTYLECGNPLRPQASDYVRLSHLSFGFSGSGELSSQTNNNKTTLYKIYNLPSD